MSCEVHVRFCEGLGVRFPWATRRVVHCRSHKQLMWIKKRIEQRLALCKLSLNPAKTRVVYGKDSTRTGDWPCQSFDFLGYTFRPRSARDGQGEFFVSFSPAISREATRSLRQTIRRRWRLKARSHLSLNELARQFNPVIAGWINYYGRFYRSALHSVLNHINHALVAWAMDKFKRFRGRKTRAAMWLRSVARRDPKLFVHWRYQGWMTRAV